MLQRSKLNVLVVTETHMTGTSEINDFTLYYSGVAQWLTRQCCVGFVIRNSYLKGIEVEFQAFSPRVDIQLATIEH